MRRRVAVYAALLLVGVLFLGGCGSIHWGNGLFGGASGDDLLTCGEETVSREEGRVLLAAMRYSYERAYGKDLQNISVDDGNMEDYMKQEAGEYLQQIFSASQMALAEGQVLSEQEQALIDTAAEQYLADCLAQGVEETEEGSQAVHDLYARLLLSQKAYDSVMSVSDDTISEESARVVRVRQIFLGFSDKEQRTSQKKRANRIVKSVSKGTNFSVLALQYHEGNAPMETDVVRGEWETERENVIFALAPGEISEAVETENGYWLYQCVDDNVEAKTTLHLQKMKEERLTALFQDSLNSYIEKQNIQWNKAVWRGLDVPEESTADFFGVYERIMNNT